MKSHSDPTTPDQGDERRAFEQWYARHMIENGFSATEQEITDLREGNHYGEHRVMLNGKWEGWQARALSAAQPVAQPVVDQEPASMSDNGSCGSQVSGKPVSAEPDRYKRALEAIIANPGGASAKRIATLALGLNGTEQVSAEAGKGADVDEATAMKGGRWVRAEDVERMAGELVSLATGEAFRPTQMVDAFHTLKSALAAPMPQPEPTSKGEAWNMEKLTNILRTYGHSGLLDAVNFAIAEASQQREPQEAAEGGSQ